ncbi:EutN/CcmL family microcompartment protein [Thermotalea metallivorans]|uniref:Carbon dioxide concentrating mechanism protein CcmL n=1 Tax=Thermotalea metallivorans TaxID=520762 RepID=A0A140L3H6_9FIRM|nr:EutN/CcmL family microcompartment protein [Thermotalea metallivorans]KXG75101.1 Carbon dioxide concentrating mechanism protein CcmL [Thermotalea metallivorans]
MKIGKIIGTVVATRKDERLTGYKLMITQALDVKGQPEGDAIIAVDTVGAGMGELVIFTTGTAARYAADKPQSPIDAAIVGIIDNIDLDEDLLRRRE